MPKKVSRGMELLVKFGHEFVFHLLPLFNIHIDQGERRRLFRASGLYFFMTDFDFIL